MAFFRLMKQFPFLEEQTRDDLSYPKCLFEKETVWILKVFREIPYLTQQNRPGPWIAFSEVWDQVYAVLV